MYQLVQNFNSLAELQAFVAAGAALGNASASAANATAPAAGKAAKAAPPSPSPSTASPSAAAPAAAPVAAPAAAPAVKERKYEDTGIGQLLKEVSVDAAKKTKAAELLKEFGAVKEDGKPSGGMLKPDQWDAFTAKLTAIKNATDDGDMT